MAKVFLSYAREDAPAAKQLADCVGRAGHDVWWDRHIQGGSRFSSEIDRELKNAAVVVVVWSATSIESAWVQDEAAEGRDSGRLVPVSLGGSRAPLGFRQFHTIALADWSGDGEPREIDDLLEAIAKTAGNSAPVTAAPPGNEPKVVRGPSVCVLPFVNMSGDPEQEYFSDGITEDIITDLSKVSALLVIARNTAFTFKGRVMDVKEVATALNVSHVLEGSVRKAGDRVRITGQLIDAATGGHVWADRYDRDLTDIFAIQDEISKAIVAALRVKLLPEEKKAIETRGTSSVEAYNFYLLARQQLIDGAFGDPRRDETIVRICQQATVIDPNYAQAWALMAFAQSELRFWHGRDAHALPAAERALAIDPDLAEVRCVKARYFEEDGKQDDADREIAEALRLDPESWEVNREAARMMFREGRIAEAVPFFEKAASLMASDWHNSSMLMSCYHGPGEEENLQRVSRMTLDRAQAALAKDPTNGAAIAVGASALARFGETDRAREWVQRGLLLDPSNLSMRYNLACALIMELHDPDAALDVLEPFFEEVKSPIHVKHLTADPDMKPIRDHPRFKAMLETARQRIGMPD
ncbi:MAG: TIR domain-containing protein [Sphingomicrobium sp.]